jgi:NAD(P)-dependent dehydrogenase (short-subunit alcohol dehydrogenase family)
MNMGLEGKVIVITGAASGIGLAVARLAQAEGAGALVLTDRDAAGCEKAAAEIGGASAVVVAALADPAAPAEIAQAAKARFGRIDGLVNAAGLTTHASLVTGTIEVWDQLFAVNARAGFFLMQEAVADMTARKAPGSIVNILSMNALCGVPALAIYSASKGAMATLTRNTARAHMADRIRVNGINLGWIDTPAERHMQSVVLGRGEGWLAEDSAAMPLGRLITAEEAARLAVFLLGEASAPMSGSIVDFEQKVAGAI